MSTSVTPADIGAVAYPTGGIDGDILTKNGTSAIWQAASGATGSLTKDALAEGLGLWLPNRKVMRKGTPVRIVENFQTGHGWVGSGLMTVTDDTCFKIVGSQSVKLY